MIRKGDRSKALLTRSEPTTPTGLPTTSLAPIVNRFWTPPFKAVQDFDRHLDHVRRNMVSLISPTASAWWPCAGAATDIPVVRPARVARVDQGKEYVHMAEMPGFDRDQIEVEVTENGIEWSARREERKSGEERRGGTWRASAPIRRFTASSNCPRKGTPTA